MAKSDEQSRTGEVPKKQPDRKKSRWLLRTVYLLTGLLGLLIIVVVLMPIISPFFRRLVEARIRALTGRETSIEDLSVSLLSSRASIGHLVIKEENSDEDFLRIEDVAADFELWPLLQNAVRLPDVTVGKVKARVRIDESGAANYQSILDRLKTEEKPTKKEPAFREIRANVQVKNASVDYENRQSGVSAALSEAALESQVKGLENISYGASGARFEFDASERDFSGAFGIDVEGKASLKRAPDGTDLSSSGTITLSGLNLKRSVGPVLADQRVELAHDMSMQAGKGLTVKDVTLDSDLFSVDVSDVRLPDPAQLGRTLLTAMAAESPAQARETLSTLQLDGCSGQMVAQTDLGKVRRIIGDGVSNLFGHSIGDFGGSVELTARIRSASQAEVQLTQGIRADDLMVAGTLKKAAGETKDFRVRLASLTQQLSTTINARELSCAGSNTLRATAPVGDEKPVELVSGNQEWNLEWRANGSSTGLHVETAQHDLHADITAIGRFAEAFLPEDTIVEGNLKAGDRLSGSRSRGFTEEGTSDLSLRVSSPLLDRPLPLHVTSDRRLRLETDPLRVAVERFDVHSQGSDLVHAEAAGEFGVNVQKPAKLMIDVQADLNELEPMLKAFGSEISMTGKLSQELELASSSGKAEMSGGGTLEDFSYRSEPDEAESIALGKVTWTDDATCYLEKGFPRRIELGQASGGSIGVQVPGLAVDVSGTIEDISAKPPFCRLQEVTVQADGDLANLPAPLRQRLERMGVRPGDTLPLRDNVRIDGPADKLELRNVLRLGGQMELGAAPGKKGVAWDLPLQSTLHLSVEGMPEFTRNRGESPLSVEVTTPGGGAPLLRVNGQNGPLAEVQAKGKISVTGAKFETSSLQFNGQVSGNEILSAVPGEYLETTGLTADSLEMGGRCELSADFEGSFPNSLKSTFAVNLQPLSARWTGKNGKLLLDKSADIPVSLDMEADIGSSNEGVSFRVDPMRLRCADLQGSGTVLIGPGMKLSGLDDAEGAEFRIAADAFDMLRKMLPWLKELELDEPSFNLEVTGLTHSPADGTMKAHARARLGLKSMSLPRLAGVLEERMGLGQAAPEETTEKTTEPAPPMELSPEFRDKLRGVTADAQVQVKTVGMGRDNRLENLNLSMGFNRDEPDNRLNVKAGAAVNPHKERKGKFELSSTGRLDGRSPRFSAQCDIVDLPVPEEMLNLMKKQAASKYSLLDSLTFAAPTGFYMGMQGSSRWQGIRWEAFKRSLVSESPVTLFLPAGEFDLEVSLDRIMGSQTIQNLLGDRLEGLRSTLEQVQGRKQDILSRLQQVQGALDSLQKAVGKLENQRDNIKQTIDRLRPLAAFSDSTAEKLDELQEKVDEYYAELQEKKDQATEKRETTSRLQQELEKTREKVQGLRQRMEEARESAFGLKQVFDFSFDGMNVELSLQNNSPWPGLDAPQGLLEYATSRLHLDRVSFIPEKEDFPQFSGWIDLAGPYRVHVMPPESVMAKIQEKAPPLATALRRSGGLVVTPQGVRPLNMAAAGSSEE